MTKTTTTIWDLATHLRTADDVAAYLVDVVDVQE
jgi:DNA-binding phage protein